MVSTLIVVILVIIIIALLVQLIRTDPFESDPEWLADVCDRPTVRTILISAYDSTCIIYFIITVHVCDAVKY